jgi:hypothetical protein
MSCQATRGWWFPVSAITASTGIVFPCVVEGMASDWTEVTVVPSVLVRSVRHATLC